MIIDKNHKMNVKPEILRNLKNYFEKKPVLRSYIFGSVSRNEANEKVISIF